MVRASVQAFKKREERPFGNLMAGVVFVISGYENPLRSELRNKALAMGARYEANWNHNCTHLMLVNICKIMIKLFKKNIFKMT